MKDAAVTALEVFAEAPGTPLVAPLWHPSARQGTGKEFPGVIKTLKPGKVMVWYDNGSKEWVPAQAVRKVDK